MPDRAATKDLPDQLSDHDPRVLIEEISCAIAEAQAALFAGRIRDFEGCITHQQQLCVELKRLYQHDGALPPAGQGDSGELVATAQRVSRQNLIFGAIVRRLRRHLNTLRNLLQGRSLSYQPQPIKVPNGES